MGSIARARVILDYLASNEVAGNPAFIHHQLEVFRGADWTVYTTRRRLQDFHDGGFLEHLEDRGRGLYYFDEEARDRYNRGLTDDDLREAIRSDD